jgi:hypothetical protein
VKLERLLERVVSAVLWETEHPILVFSPAYQWSDRALLRAVQWLQNRNFSDGKRFTAEGDDIWQVYLINKRYVTKFLTNSTASLSIGKMIGFTEWTHSATSTTGNTLTPPGC